MRSGPPGLPLLALLAAVSGTALWLSQSGFAAIRSGADVEYVLLSASAWVLAASIVGAFALLAGVHAVCSRFCFGHGSGSREVRQDDVSYLAPAGLLAFTLLPLLSLIPWLERAVPPLNFLFADLRAWVALLAAALIVRNIDRRSGRVPGAVTARWRERLAGRSLIFPLELGVALCAILFAIASSPTMRFNSQLHGDETKYIRFAELLYQGCGFELSCRKDVAALPADDRPRIGQNLSLLARELRRDARSAAADLRMLMRGEKPEGGWNRGRYAPDLMLNGKAGGIYQMHTPGTSFLIFPAYFVDRYLLSWDSGHHPNFPREHLFTMTLVLLFYGIVAALTFRMIHAYSGRPGLSAGLAALAAIVIPIGNFPFQLYPEIPAAMFITAITWQLLRAERSTWTCALIGAMAGFLPWFHVRFLIAAAVFPAWVWLTPRSWRERRAFALGWALAMATIVLYAYHLTGSPLPTAMYTVRGGEEGLNLQNAAPGAFGYLFDRAYGILPYSPVFLLALAGILPMLRTRTREGLLVLLVFGSTAFVGSLHGYSAAGATAGRYLVGVIPLAMIPLVETVRRFGHAPVFRVLFTILAALSIQSAWVYNEHHVKSIGRMLDDSVSGWKLHLTFPEHISGTSFNEPWVGSPLTALWITLTAIVVLAPVLIRDRGERARRVEPPYTTAFAIALFVLAAGASLLTSARPVQVNAEYMREPAPARRALVGSYTAQGCWLCVSSKGGRIDPARWLTPVEQSMTLAVAPAAIKAGEGVTIRIDGEAPPEWVVWGTLTVDFGDGDRLHGVPFSDSAHVPHAYQRAGRYEGTVTLQTATGPLERRFRVVVEERKP